jgi:hypothetical protein
MFGRKAASGRDVLAERMRQIAEPRPAPAAAESAATFTSATTPAPSVAKSVRKQDRAPRQSLFRTATLITSAGARQNVALKDVSATGARIEYHTRGTLPEIVVLIEPMLKLHKRARVVWQDEGIAGLEFLPQ